MDVGVNMMVSRFQSSLHESSQDSESERDKKSGPLDLICFRFGAHAHFMALHVL